MNLLVPARPPAESRHDWRDTVRVAADVALFGFVVTAAVLPVVTAGAAVAAGSAAMHHFVTHDRWPTAGAMWSVFRRQLLPGLLVIVGLGVAASLLTINVTALQRGVVPGGRPLVVLTLALVATAIGYAGLVVVAIGAHPERGWRGAARAAASQAVVRPATLPAAVGVIALAALLGALVHPVVTPVLVGSVLFALHIAVGRLDPPQSDAAAPQ